MTTLDQTRLGLAARLETIAGLRVYDLVPGDINPPGAIIGSPTINDYRAPTDAGLDTDWRIALAVSTANPEDQLKLYPLLERTGSQSVWNAIETDRTLGGLDVDAFVISATPLGMQDIGGNRYYVSTVTVRALIS